MTIEINYFQLTVRTDVYYLLCQQTIEYYCITALGGRGKSWINLQSDGRSIWVLSNGKRPILAIPLMDRVTSFAKFETDPTSLERYVIHFSKTYHNLY